MNDYLKQINAVADVYSDCGRSIKYVLRIMIQQFYSITKSEINTDGIRCSKHYDEIYYEEYKFYSSHKLIHHAFHCLDANSPFYPFQLANLTYDCIRYVLCYPYLLNIPLIKALHSADDNNKILLDVYIRNRIIYANGVQGIFDNLHYDSVKLLVLLCDQRIPYGPLDYISKFNNLQIFINYPCINNLSHLVLKNNPNIKLIKHERDIYHIHSDLSNMKDKLSVINKLTKLYKFVDRPMPRYCKTKNARSNIS